MLFRPNWDLFDRSLEKVVSISASIASSTFTHTFGSVVNFDSRVWLGVDHSQIVDYFRWRQADATRCALNGWCYWTLRKAGESKRSATATLEGQSIAFKNELLFQHGINFNALPTWQRRGVGLYWEDYEKPGFDPVRKQEVVVKRHRIKVDEELPMKEAYDEFLYHQINVESDK